MQRGTLQYTILGPVHMQRLHNFVCYYHFMNIPLHAQTEILQHF